MKKLAIISLSIGLALSGSLMAKDKDHVASKHYGDSQFNGQYYDHDDRYNDTRRGSYANYNTYGSSKIKRARVVDVDPVFSQYARQPYGRQASRQECWNEPRNRRHSSDRKAGSLIGAVLGGVIGYKVGGNHRHNKRSGAAVGAVLGSVIGGKAAKNSRHSSNRHCETVYDDRGYSSRDYDRRVYNQRDYGQRNRDYRGYDQQQIVGYNVTYKYKGQRYKTFMDYKPGRYIDIRVSTQPVRR